MVRLSKLTDYGLVLMGCFARSRPESLHSARELAAASRLPLPTVSKLLKELLRCGLLVSHRGTQGGYRLARQPKEISLAEIIAALEGPVAWTECSTEGSGACELETCCAIKQNQQLINQALKAVLDRLMLSDLIQPIQLTSIQNSTGISVPAVQLTRRIQ